MLIDFRVIFDHSPLPIYILQDDYFRLVNPKMAEFAGYTVEELLKIPFYKLVHPADRLMVVNKARQRLAGEDVPGSYEFRTVNLKGETLYAQGDFSVIEIDGRPAILGQIINITEQKQAQKVLQKSKEELESLNEELIAVNEELRATEEELKQQLKELHKSRETLATANKRLTDIIEFLPDPTFVVDQDKEVIAWNQAIEEMTGVFKENIIGKGNYAYAVPFYGKPRPMLIDFVGTPNNENVEDYYNVVFKKGSTLYGEVYISDLHKDKGACLWSAAAPLYDNQGNIVGAIHTIRDITKSKRQEAYFQQLFEHSPLGIAMLDNQNKIIRVNEGFENLFQYKNDNIAGKSINDLIVPEDMLDESYTIQNDILSGTIVQKETVRKRKDGTLLEVYFLGYPIIIDRKLAGVYAIYSDITERKQYEEKLIYLSLHDSLTGLYNRFFCEEEMGRVENEHYCSVGIIVCDIDGLKLINDTLGHDAGDTLLKNMANLLKNIFRENGAVARIGGDEFAILLTDTDINVIESAVQEIRNTVECYNSKDPELRLSVSVGFAHYGKNAINPLNMEKLFKEADNNMYREKLHRSQSARSAIVQTLMKALDARDYITEGHADRLQKLVVNIASSLGLPERTISDLRLFAQFHDIGKVGIPDHILFKAGPLTREEFTIMQRHSEIGHRIALSAPDLVPIADWILKHHEWWNGNGYPIGLIKEEIPLECRILAIADAYDAMTSERPYHKAMSHKDALAELIKFAGIQFDPQLVQVFIRTYNAKCENE